MDARSNVDYSKEYFEGNKRMAGAYTSYEYERFSKAFAELRKALVEMVNVERVLDIGCAKGFLVSEFRTNGIEAYGIDISKYAIESAPVNLKPFLHVVDLNKDRIPFPDNFFNVIICMGTLEYIEQQEYAVAELNRVLGNDSFLFITTLSHTTKEDSLRLFAKDKSVWDRKFSDLGYKEVHDDATKVFYPYITNVNTYDFAQYLNSKEKQNLLSSIKRTIYKILYNVGFSGAIRKALNKKNLGSGYLMLGYKKNTIR